MSTEAEINRSLPQPQIKECLESVWSEVKKSEVLENILVHSDDDPEVPEGQLPSANQVAVIAGVSSLAPDDDSVAPGGLVEARCVGEVANRSSRGSPPPRCSSKLEEVPYSPTSRSAQLLQEQNLPIDTIDASQHRVTSRRLHRQGFQGSKHTNFRRKLHV